MKYFEPKRNQRKAIRFAVERTHAAWWVGMGGGKTACAMSVARYRLHRFDCGRVLVVAPKRVAEDTWPTEHQEWAHLVGLRVAELRGTPKQRQAAAESEADIYVISRDNVAWLVRTFAKRWRWDALIYDESSGLKRAGTQRFKALRKVQHLFNWVLLLTGTPRPNSLLELWPQVWMLDRGDRLGRTVSRYKERWFQRDFMGYNWEPVVGAADEIHARLADICISLDSDADLPEPEYAIERVELPDPKEYRRFERTKVLAAKNERGAIMASSAGTLVQKLAQFANGFVYDEEGVGHEVHDVKLRALDTKLDGIEGNVLLAYWFQEDLARLKRRYPHAETLSAPDAIARWNRGEIDLLLVHPQSAGHGLNLQFGGADLVWLGPIWSLELWQQTIARLQRTGQTRPVTVHVLVASGTADELMMAALHTKDAGQRSTLMALRDQLQKVA